MCDDFNMRNKAEWTETIRQTFGDTVPRSGQWTDVQAILNVLSPFMGENRNHTMLPGTGGMDMKSISRSSETGCLEFCCDDRVAEVFRAGDLFFEHFPESTWNSFFFLETQTLEPCGVYETSDGEYEEVVEVSPDYYVSRSHWDDGILSYDGDGREILLPKTSRVLCRLMQGKFLVVAKASIWNQVSATYDGRHNRMTAQQIRQCIQSTIDGSTNAI